MEKKIPAKAKECLDMVNALVVMLSVNGNVEFLNLYAAELLGSDKKEILGRNWFEDFVSMEGREEELKQFKEFLAGAETHKKYKSYFIRTKKGDLRLIEWHCTRLLNGKSDIVGSFYSGRDITEKHVLELYIAEQEAKHRKVLLDSSLEATERERKFLAYELHDGVNQVLATCKLLLDTEMANGNASIHVKKASKYLDETIHTLRELAHELNPAEPEHGNLHEAARELVARINAAQKIKANLEVKGAKYFQGLSSHTCISLYRIMQEALNNIIKHAGATNVGINLTASDNAIDLEIRDDGKGFKPKKKASGLGLKTIYTRAEAEGGKAFLSSSPGEGTLLSIHIPVDAHHLQINKEDAES